MRSVTSYIALGSNLGQPIEQLDQAVVALNEMPDTELLQVSSYYRSAPMGPQEQPDYVNAVACLITTLSAEALLDQLQAIEHRQGRTRQGLRWGPRTLDLDIIMYASKVIQTPRLTVPHTGLFERNFVLYPLQEISPNLQFPDGRTMSEVMENCPLDGLVRIENNNA
ncbi:MAG: 2-amino-4-hydroxy-6-hydroxymethyldihydropteridine diphosphokinase [Gammaproteobacteria bacterium]|nr:2-amino-4-hydroxy-6-hydroxymethyldihydropteridine diphosphokinase [Gammaproteobacteria bacterium]